MYILYESHLLCALFNFFAMMVTSKYDGQRNEMCLYNSLVIVQCVNIRYRYVYRAYNCYNNTI